jgi:hypothetical protein
MPNLTPLPLIDTADVHSVMGSDPELLAAVTASVESAITRAGLKLGTVLDTNLAPLYNTDTFFIEESLPPLNGRYRLRLRNGLVRQDVAFTVQWSDDPYADASSWQDVIGAVMDYEKGFVQVPVVDAGSFNGSRWRRQDAFDNGVNTRFYVKVVYASGLCAERDTATNYEELRQAMLCYVPLLMLSTSSAETGASSSRAMAAMLQKTKSLEDQADDMLFRYMRRVAPAGKPFQHTQTALTSTQT